MKTRESKPLYDWAAPPGDFHGTPYDLINQFRMNISYRLGPKNAAKAQCAIDEVLQQYIFLPDFTEKLESTK